MSGGDRGAGSRFVVRLVPRGGRDEIVGVDADGRLRVRVAAPPLEGAANEALIRLLARELGVGRTAVTLEAGATARVKTLRVSVAIDELRARWPGLEVRG